VATHPPHGLEANIQRITVARTRTDISIHWILEEIMNCFEGCINTNSHQVKKTRSKSGPNHRKKRESMDWNFEYNSHPFVVEEVIKARTLKPLPITKNNKTGDFFHHPDIPIINMDELVQEALASQGYKDGGGSQSSSIPSSDFKIAWMSKNVFQSRRASDKSLNFTPILEIQCMDYDEKEASSKSHQKHSGANSGHRHSVSSSANNSRISDEESATKYNSSFSRTRESQTRVGKIFY